MSAKPKVPAIAPERETVGESEIRPINVMVAREAAGNEKPTFIPGGSYKPEKFPNLERAKKQWDKKLICD